MDNDFRLFGTRRISDWMKLRQRIVADANDNIWPETLKLVDWRLETRYFNPIRQVLGMSLETGEGFAVMTLICSLIEFLQSMYEGKTYVYRGTPSDTVYVVSGPKFKDFLEQHEPFKEIFTRAALHPSKGIETIADDFYTNVRCGLLHEAATNNGWTIRSSTAAKNKDEFVDIQTDKCKIIYRENFVTKIEEYVMAYKEKIAENKTDTRGLSLRHNLCRKLDSLCSISDKTPSWWHI